MVINITKGLHYATALARRDFLAACGALAFSPLTVDSCGLGFHCALGDAQFESAVLRFAAAAVSARFGSARPSAGDVPDAAPIDAPARTHC